MKRKHAYFFAFIAMFLLSVNSALAAFVKVISEDGTVSWIGIKGTINDTNINIFYYAALPGTYKPVYQPVIDTFVEGVIDLNEVWSENGGVGTHYQVTDIGVNAFVNCSGLTTVIIPNNVSSISEGAFAHCTGMTSITIPNRLTSIGNLAFQNCSALTSITIPNRVNSIGNSAFVDCKSLTSITIPNSVTSIGNYAFSGCTNLEKVYSEITNVYNIDTSVFSYGSENATLYVPQGLLNTYITTPGWNVFFNIEEKKSEILDSSFILSCNSKGSVTINENNIFTNKIGSVEIFKDAENTFVFTPKPNCKLEQVNLNGFDISPTIVNNTLKSVIPTNSQMIVTFATEAGDMNNDGDIDISDVVVLVNLILSK